MKVVVTMKVIHHYQENTKHDWYLNEDGDIDVWQLDEGFHNGPRCRSCGYTFCEHCNPDGYNSMCVRDWHECPRCGTEVRSTQKYCSQCGVKLDWE